MQNLYRLHKTIKIENFNERKDKFYLKIWRQNQKLLGDVSSIFITEFRKKIRKKKFENNPPFFKIFGFFSRILKKEPRVMMKLEIPVKTFFDPQSYKSFLQRRLTYLWIKFHAHFCIFLLKTVIFNIF